MTPDSPDTLAGLESPVSDAIAYCFTFGAGVTGGL